MTPHQRENTTSRTKLDTIKILRQRYDEVKQTNKKIQHAHSYIFKKFK